MTTEEVQAAAIAENLKNPDGTEITTEEQLTAARELAANPAGEHEETPEEKAARELREAEEAAANDPLLKVLLADRKTEEQLEEPPPDEKPVVPAPDPAAERVKNLATLKEWGVTIPDDATDEAIAAKVAEGKPAAPIAEKKKKRFSVVKKEHEAIIEQPATTVAAPVTESGAPAPDVDADYIKTLTAEQQDELYEAEVAELLEPVKFKDQKKKLVEFFKRFDKEAVEIAALHPDVKEIEEIDEFKALARAKPVLDKVTVKRVNREIGSREGERRAETKLSPKIQEMEMAQRRLELKPVFQKFVVEEFKPGINTLIEGDTQSPVAEAFKVIKEKGVKYAKDEGYALEAKIYTEETEAAATRAEKFLLFKNNAIVYNQEKPDLDIKWVMEFVESECKIFADYEAKHGRLMDKQRNFLPRREFIQMLRTNADEAATLDRPNWKTKNYCTVTDTGILDWIARAAKQIIEGRVKQVQQNAEEVGFQRRPKADKTPAVNQPRKTPAELAPPRATPAPANGAGRQPEPPKPQQTIDVLGINYPTMKRPR